MKKAFSILIVVFFNTSIVLSQSFEIRNLDNKHNLNSLNLHWATAKLCKKYYEKEDLITEFKKKSSFRLPGNRNGYGCNVCFELLKNRHPSYFEYFVYRFLNDRRIQQNKTNVFKLRELRKEIEEKYLDLYNEAVESVDTENMVFYTYDLVTGYDIEKEELYIKMFYPDIKKIAYAITEKLINAPFLEKSIGANGRPFRNADLGVFKISMPENEAQKVYDRYKNHFRPNPPFCCCN